MKKNIKLLIPLLIVPFLLSGCQAVLINSKGQVGIEERSLILISTLLMLIVVIPVIIMTIVFAYRYRASNEKATYSPNWTHSTKVEFWVWFVPCVIIAILATITWISTHKLDPHRPLSSTVKPLSIEVVALDWKWLFIYPDQGIATVNHIEFPVNVPVHFRITAGDTAMNGFFIPQLGSQIMAMAGMQTQLYLIANEVGVYDGFSSNLSGDGFSGMRFTAQATSQADFDQWVKTVHHASQILNKQTYQALAKPTENNPVQYYGQVQNHLFEGIIASFMMPHMPATPATSSHETHY